ncbi:hypothetical protein [Cytobacillus horneckiae]|uniref:Uncharacterized protein n=1 Tax=Cytobacillus horneckiae TaxID=549687 RepID=A0A2N0ZMD5_9BACI|nr:hypothetical protein [Cytobacillus horneckiae]MEC1155025.1 hypothetical protein [Cytobacillus horneckiae]MED2936069.1 hypothetical protein [Cytobacillus horneckiae]PKG30657.1 hypothetical protein CWS20_01860 [Cytobacillus horneckiae]
MPLNKFLGIEYTRYGFSASTHDRELTDEIIAKGMVRYLRQYYKYDGKWNGINVHGRELSRSDFFQTAEIKPRRFYEIFKTEDRAERFLAYFNEFNVRAELKHGFLTLIDLEHPKRKNS